MPTTYKVLGQVGTTSASRTITFKQLGNNTASVTVNADHNMAIGQPVTVASVSQVNTVTNRVLTSSVASLTIGAHTFAVGQSITVENVDTPFNGTYNVLAVSPTVVAYTKANASVASQASSGTVTGLDPAFNGTYTVTSTPSARIFTYTSSSSVTYASTAASGAAVHSPWNVAYAATGAGVQSAVTSTLTVTNRSAISSGQYQLAISSSSVTPAAKDYVVYNDLIAANDMVAMTLGLTVDSTNKYIMFAGSHASLSFNIFGAEITT
jgi:hypothetical protein